MFILDNYSLHPIKKNVFGSVCDHVSSAARVSSLDNGSLPSIPGNNVVAMRSDLALRRW